MRLIIQHISGMALTVGLVLLCLLLQPQIGINSTLAAIILGFMVANLLPIPAVYDAGIKWCESHGLSIAVALLALQLDWQVMAAVDNLVLLFIGLSVLFTFMMARLLARPFGLSVQQTTLVASGQAICGSAAIMAVQKVIKAPSLAASQALVLVNFLGFVGIFFLAWLLPWVFADLVKQKGIMIGNTLQSMGHVVAAGFAVNEGVGQTAVLIKMCRILLLLPLLLLLLLKGKYWGRENSQGTDATTGSWLRWIPWFIWAFVALMVIDQLHWIGESQRNWLIEVGDFFFLVAMVAIGLGIRLRAFFAQAHRLLLFGVVLFALQLVFSGVFLYYLY
ncbi:putative sulfate exporter family transporter [Marinicella sp. S1101]|uniref:YeiH family protein n=1 Tax=Marinicella marina TaxID=2996016 RepID=UPI002260D841|nr:putative sulfate exporter family transporter [Marinicella marina]MCX7552423.1 putative sulfate exporter family transporter [Marinicella marina]